jgi:hypothetical protein
MKCPRLAPALLVAMMMSLVCRCGATGYYEPTFYLGDGGTNIEATPEFYWELEVKRLAKNFHPSETFMLPAPVATNEVTTNNLGSTDVPTNDLITNAALASLRKATADADLADFEAALKDGAVKPPDPAAATKQNAAARNVILAANEKATNALPAEFDSEFSDYHKGAFAFAQGKDHWDEAQQAWEALLRLPAAQRHYRSVWAAFMLGKLALKNNDPQAVKWFQKTRDLAKNGFADSLGMAADSYGWEGRSEWKQGHPLALGDQSAIVSLKALIPDRDAGYGSLDYGPGLDERNSWTSDQKKQFEDKVLEELKIDAKDPLLRRLITAHILCADAFASDFSETGSRGSDRRVRWLEVINEANIAHIEDAEYLGWVAYSAGDYQQATRWLKLANPDSPATCWLRAKLQLREGKLDEALHNMTKAFDSLRTIYPCVQTSSEDGSGNSIFYAYPAEGEWEFSESASGDLGQLHLTRGDFIQALDIFWKGGLWNDAAFVAESVLTTDELKAYVDKQPLMSTAATYHSEDQPQDLRYLLGRRLVRDGRFTDAERYLQAPYDKIVAKYAKSLMDAKNEKLPKVERASDYFTAAWLARHDGMEIMGTEVAPDGFDSGGDFEAEDVAQQRLSGHYEDDSSENGEQKPEFIPAPLKPSSKELERLKQNKINPDIRYHYRIIAAELALKAAALLDDNTEELADVLNTAGQWPDDNREKLADHFYYLIERRCPRTRIGKAVIAKNWFVDETGPWSDAQRIADGKLHADLGGNRPQQ